MLKYKNFGRKSLTELVEKLDSMGLHFGMEIDNKFTVIAYDIIPSKKEKKNDEIVIFFEIERNIFFGNKNKIINNETVLIKGNINKDNVEIKWEMEKIE